MKEKPLLKYLLTHAYTAVWTAALLTAALVLLTRESVMLWKVQEQDLFLWTSLFFEQQLVVPAGILTWLGTFFTQFLFHPWLGILLLTLCWWLLMWLLKRTFLVPNRWAPLLLVPVALLLTVNVDMDYWIYLQKMHGWFFSATIGVTLLTALLWLFRSLPELPGVRQVFICLAALAGYPLLGVYALVAVALMGLWAWRIEQNKTLAAVDTLLAGLCVAGVPLLYYRYVYYETHIADIYTAGLPVFRLVETYHDYYIPYELLAACLLLLAVTYNKHRAAQQDCKAVSSREKTGSALWLKVCLPQTAVLALAVYGVTHYWYTDENYRHELFMQQAVEQQQWDKVLEEAARQKDEPTRVIVMLRNLALWRLGRQGNEMYSYPNGSKAAAADISIQSSLLIGNTMYYHYGLMNDCHHVCIERGVKFGWSVKDLMYMARSALFIGDTKAVRKFAGLLKHTLYYADWAERQEQLAQNPERLLSDPETVPILPMLHYPDKTGADSGNNIERHLMNILARMDAPTVQMQEQCLLAAMWSKDARLFWPRYMRYLQLLGDNAVPRHYQEAACLFANEALPEGLNVHYSPEVAERYDRFARELAAYDGQEVDDARQALYPLYGDTYFYDFYLMNDLVFF